MGTRLRWAGMLVALGLLVAGCGGGDDSSAGSAPTGGSAGDGGSPTGGGAPAAPTPTPQHSGTRALLIIARNNFQERELNETRDVLAAKGIAVTLASSTMADAVGSDETTREKPALLVKDAQAADYDAIVFIGGEGAAEYYDDPAAQNLAKTADQAGKIVAAICVSPSILARAGLLQGKKATSDYGQLQDLRQHGATAIEMTHVVVDGRIITGSGPIAAKEFGAAIATALGK